MEISDDDVAWLKELSLSLYHADRVVENRSGQEGGVVIKISYELVEQIADRLAEMTQGGENEDAWRTSTRKKSS